jgi:hypothetical protein
MPVYRIKPTALPRDPPAADFSCEGCGKVLGVVRTRVETRLVPPADAINKWPEMTQAVRQHEQDCENLL